jgi:hypothetical protein
LFINIFAILCFVALTAFVTLHNQIASRGCVITRTVSEIDVLESDIASTKTDISYWHKKIDSSISA